MTQTDFPDGAAFSRDLDEQTEGKWRPWRAAVAWTYTLDLECGVCLGTKTLNGIAGEHPEGTEYAPAVDIGTWRRIANPDAGRHDSPFARQHLVVCSPACADEAHRAAMEKVYPDA